ncbi:MAG: glycerol kinase GlpK [marine benthic group bacterium]|nr:glycerol kinase GlpK [Gemmatimonadota bacterium]
MSPAGAVLAIDQGTTGSRAMLMDHGGNVLGAAYEEFRQYFPAPGRVEHDAEQIWDSVISVVGRAVAEAGITPSAVAAIGITNQRETTVVWDRATGRPLDRAIVWQDRRTSDRCAELRALGYSEMIRERTGLVLDPYFSATKLEWLLRENTELRDRAAAGEACFGTIDSWLVFKLTGGAIHATDHTNASRTMLYGLEARGWDPELCELFGVPAGMLPAIHPSAGVIGRSDPSLLGAEIPISGMAGDQQSALYGHGGWTAGDAKNTYGTGAFLLLHCGDERGTDEEGVLTTVACGPRGEPQYAKEGSILVAGSALQWLRDGLGLISDSSESEALARSVPDTAGVVFVPALAGLGTPWWEPDARGTIFGLTRGTERAHLVRAALEAMACGTVEVVEAMARSTTVEPGRFRADGGAAKNDWLMQFQSDLLGLDVHRPGATELTAIGAAGLAGVGCGFWDRPEDFLDALGEGRVFRPGPEAAETRQRAMSDWKRAIRALLSWSADD